MIMFKVTGVSRFKGQVKVRFANDMTRVKLLVKAGNTDIELIELADATDKAGCVKALLASDLYKNPVFAEAIDAANEKYNPAVKVKAAKVAKPKAEKPSLEKIKARATKKSEADVQAAELAAAEPAPL
jgi:hypothetical protein